jgi:uncharacterized protein (DUF885 family)
MRRITIVAAFIAFGTNLSAGAENAFAAPSGAVADRGWITKSNGYSQMLIDIGVEHYPEFGSREGLAKFDKLIHNPSLEDELAARRESQAALDKIKAQQVVETDRDVQLDLEILRKAVDYGLRSQDFALQHEVPFFNPSLSIYAGIHDLLDDQVAPERRLDAVARLRRYAGVEPGYTPYTDLLKQRLAEQMAKPGVVFPSKDQIETEFGRNSNYVDEIPRLFEKYHLTGWEEPYARLKTELAGYDVWMRANVLPKARTDFRLPPERYALLLESYGIDISPDLIAVMAHAAFNSDQAQMTVLAAQVAREKHLPKTDYRSVIAELKKQQITGQAILPLYQMRLHEIEQIIESKTLATLPNRPAIIRLASEAESAEQPAPHMNAPPLVNNTGQRGEFVLPLNIPASNGGAADKYDDFTSDAVSWTMIAHEARPGHELQFDSMVENGVSLARAIYAGNSTNIEGWGLYSEYVMQPFEPADGQFMTLQLRLLRDARAFLDPELQSGKITPQQAYDVLEKDVVLSHAFAKEEVERFTYRMPGQANSYFYGYTKLLALRKETEAALGKKFDQRKFHDFIIGQGLRYSSRCRSVRRLD